MQAPNTRWRGGRENRPPFVHPGVYALGGLAGGQDSPRMDWLYESFAQETANTLMGVKKEKESG